MTSRTATRLALLVAVATTLQIAESLIPKPLPWLRLGLANGVTLLAIARLSWRAAFAITAVRVFLGALLLGTLGGPAFFLSAAGGLAAALVMTVVHRCFAPRVSLLGVSVAGSAAHVGAQLATLGALTGAGAAVLALAPLLAATAIPLGLVTGAVVLAAHRRLAPWEAAW